jgi:hypothetical protein
MNYHARAQDGSPIDPGLAAHIGVVLQRRLENLVHVRCVRQHQRIRRHDDDLLCWKYLRSRKHLPLAITQNAQAAGSMCMP